MMKKLMRLVFIFLTGTNVFAQENDNPVWKKTAEIRAGWGMESSYSFAEEGGFGCFDSDLYEPPKINLNDRKPLGDKYTSGSVWLGASVSLSRFWDVGATATFERFWQDFVEGRAASSYVGVHATGRINYINTQKFRLYSSLSIGIHTVIRNRLAQSVKNDHFSFIPDSHFNCIGVSVGKTVFGFTELGIGPKGIITGGIGYRFQ